jgi:hypothetical protein
MVIPISRGMFLLLDLSSSWKLASLLLQYRAHEMRKTRKITMVIKRFITMNRNHPRPKVVTMTLDSIERFGVARYVVDISKNREQIRSMNITRYREREEFFGE